MRRLLATEGDWVIPKHTSDVTTVENVRAHGYVALFWLHVRDVSVPTVVRLQGKVRVEHRDLSAGDIGTLRFPYALPMYCKRGWYL